MTATLAAAPRRSLLATLLLPAALGLAWNLYGIVQFAGMAFKDTAGLEAAGMTAAQAALYAGLPGWMTLAFAIGVFGGTAGSALLLARRALAVPVLAVSLAAYGVLFAGDAALGVFAAFGAGQVAILTLVVAIAAGLLLLARRAARRGDLA